MRLTIPRAFVLSFTIATAIAGCTLIAEVDRSKIPNEPEDEGGMGGDDNSGGDSGTGGESVGGQGGESAMAGANQGGSSS